MSNSYPMTKNRALQTTPYTFTVSSTCPDSTGFSVYIATLNTNTLPDSAIHYIITEQGNTNVISEGILSEATNGLRDLQDYEISDLNNGINGTYGSIYRLYTGGIQQDTEVSYDLYLYIDESVTNETMGQTFSAGVAIKTSDYGFATVDQIAVTETTTDSITVSVSATAGTNAIQTYYYSINNGEYVSSSNNTYTFSGLEIGTEYTIKVYVEDSNGVMSNILNVNENTSNVLLADWVISQYDANNEGANGIYYHDGQGNYTNADQEAGDYSYRYTGGDYKITSNAISEGYTNVYGYNSYVGVVSAYCNENNVGPVDYCDVIDELYYITNYDKSTHYSSLNEALEQAVSDGYLMGDNINNFVCFGSDAATCPSDNLYRIIGAFNDSGKYQVKLIKADYAQSNLLGTNGDFYSSAFSDKLGTYHGYYKGWLSQTSIPIYYWNSSGTNIWSASGLNTVNLNTNYLNNLDNEWSNKISQTNWKVGGYNAEISLSAKTVFENEIKNPVDSTVYRAKIGLMYMSDMMYTSISPIDPDGSWMSMGLDEWTITRNSSTSEFALNTTSIVTVATFGTGVLDINAVRPCFYLNSDVAYSSGTGTESDPIRIVV